MVIILKALDKVRIDEVINLSKEMNRSTSQSKRFLYFFSNVPTYAQPRSHYIHDRSSASST